MDLNHLHLHVRDVGRSIEWWSRFGFRPSVRHGDVELLRNADGFDLALAPHEPVEPLPGNTHVGFRLDSPDAVRAMATDLRADVGDEGDYVTFRVRDPDGHAVEVYWEAVPPGV